MPTEIIIGKPYTWKFLNYGTIAVHVKSIHKGIATIIIDGGEASTPAQRFPALSDGIAHVVINKGRLSTRPARVRSNKKSATPGGRKIETPQEEVTF